MADGPRSDEDHRRDLAVATELYATGEGVRALELLPDLVAERPDDIEVRVLLARCLATAGVPAVALAAADAAVACDPTSWEAHVLLARAALATDPDRAAVAADRAVQLAPHEPETGRVLTAVEAARTAAATGADKPKPRSGLGTALGLRPSPTATSTEPPPEPLTPRLPAALAATPAAPSVEPRLPAALDPSRAAAPVPSPAAPPTSTAPAPMTAPASPSSPPPPVTEAAGGPREGLAPVLPASLGGLGLAGTALHEDEAGGSDRTETPEGVTGGRLAIRYVGLALWLFFGFRYGVQVIGGPLGFALFALVAVGVGFAAPRVARA